jgi:hypothetical protein
MIHPMDPLNAAPPPAPPAAWPGWTADKAEALMGFARRYIWWKTPAEAMAQPERVIAQVMNLGDHGDVEAMARMVGDAVLRDVLIHAGPGQFGERAWAYWHYRLELAGLERVPPLPTRSFGP